MRVAHTPDTETAPRRKPRVALVVLGALVILVAVVWVAGGLRAQPNAIAAVRPGATVDQGAYAVRVLDARAGRMKINTYDAPANILVVRMLVTDQTPDSHGVGTFLEGVAGEPKPGSFIAPDTMKSEGDVQGNDTSTIHPRLPVIVQVRWPLAEDTTPSTVKIAFRSWAYGQGFTDDDFNWTVTKQSPIKATVSVPVRTGATS